MRARLCPHLAELPQPRVGVLLGGPRKGMPLDARYARNSPHRLLARQQQRRRQRAGAGLAPHAISDDRTLRAALRDVPGLVWAGADDGANPYPGVLGWADRLVVTPDSVNMLSEACAVGCPVHTFCRLAIAGEDRAFPSRPCANAGLLHDLDDLRAPLARLLRSPSCATACATTASSRARCARASSCISWRCRHGAARTLQAPP